MKIGIAGCGLIGREHARFFLKKSSVSELVIADPRSGLDKTVKTLPHQNKLTTCQDYTDLTGCDVIVIALPSEMHLEAVKFFADKTGVLLIEKPLGKNLTEVQQIIEMIKKSNVRAFYALTEYFNLEFQAMYQQLDKGTIGQVVRVAENYHESHNQLEMYLRKECGVLNENGVHSLYRFLKIAQIIKPESQFEIKQGKMTNNYFTSHSGEDTADCLLYLGDIPFELHVSFRNGFPCENGWPINYNVVIQGTKGIMTTIGWERCESLVNGKHKIHYQHPAGSLGHRSQYERITDGLEIQNTELLKFLNATEKTHFTFDEALALHRLIEGCYKKAGR